MDGVFQFLFKYRPLVFEEGEFALGAPTSVRVWLVGVALLGALAVASYTLARGKSSPVDRAVMAGLRRSIAGGAGRERGGA